MIRKFIQWVGDNGPPFLVGGLTGMITLLVVGLLVFQDSVLIQKATPKVISPSNGKSCPRSECKSKGVTVVWDRCPPCSCPEDASCATCLDPRTSRADVDTIKCPRYLWSIVHGSREQPMIYYDDSAAQCPAQRRAMDHCLVYSRCVEKMKSTVCRPLPTWYP